MNFLHETGADSWLIGPSGNSQPFSQECDWFLTPSIHQNALKSPIPFAFNSRAIRGSLDDTVKGRRVERDMVKRDTDFSLRGATVQIPVVPFRSHGP